MKKIATLVLVFLALLVIAENPLPTKQKFEKTPDFSFTEVSVNMNVGELHDFYFQPKDQMMYVTFSFSQQSICQFTYINIVEGYIRVKALNPGWIYIYGKRNGKVAKCQIIVK